MNRYTLTLHISNQEFSRLYRGEASSVLATTETGLTIRFPARSLRPYLKPDGVHGRFEVITTEQQKLIEIRELMPES